MIGIKLFDEYKKFPEYNLKNSSMTLIEFKKFFFGNIFIECGDVYWFSIFYSAYLFFG